MTTEARGGARRVVTPPLPSVPRGARGSELALFHEREARDFAPRAGPAFARMLRALGIPSGRVADLGCRSGHVAQALSRRGYDVTAVAGSRAAASLVRQRAPRARVRVARIEAAGLPAAVSAVVATYDALNGVLRPAALRDLFRRVRRALPPRGVFIFDLSTPEAYRRYHGRVQVRRLPGRFLVLEDVWHAGQGLGRRRLTGFVRQGELHERIEEEHVRRGYEPEEVEALLAQAGLEPERLAGYWESPDVLSEERLFYLARPV